jgi:hypothetical protein
MCSGFEQNIYKKKRKIAVLWKFESRFRGTVEVHDHFYILYYKRNPQRGIVSKCTFVDVLHIFLVNRSKLVNNLGFFPVPIYLYTCIPVLTIHRLTV